jgi:hypothetical protein
MLALAWLLGASGPAQADADERARDPLAYEAEEAMAWGDIDTLERLYSDATARGELNAWNARSARQSVRSGLAAVFKYGGLNEAYFRELELLTGRWAAERPKSVLAQLLYVRALYAHAWHVRGNGYWRTVPPNAQAEFTRLIAKAEQHVADRSPWLMQDTTTHLYLLMIGRSASWPFERLQAVAEDALARSTSDEYTVLEELATSLLPKWGGSWERLARFIEESDRRSQARHGHEYYAQLWDVAAGSIEGNLFAQTKADWARVRQGFEQLAGRYGHPYYANRLAYFACLAEDRSSTRSALARLNDQPDLSLWSGGGANGRQNYEACMRWLGESR